MEKTKQQIEISVERQQLIGALVSTDGDDVIIKFDTDGKITTSTALAPKTVDSYDEAAFIRPLNKPKRYKMAEHGYFSPEFDDEVIVTIHVTEVRRGEFNVTFNAYRRAKDGVRYVDPQYLGSKVAQVGKSK